MMNGSEHEPNDEAPQHVSDDLLARAMPGEASPDEHEEREADDERPSPRIYVASLSDYNAGNLHGAWINAAQEVEELYVDISVMLAESEEPGAEEWAIHDYEGFGPLELHEYESVVSRLALGIGANGLAFAAWAGHVGTGVEVLEGFFEAFMGEWPSVEDYAEGFLEQLGLEEALEGLPEWLRPHMSVDIQSFALSLETDGDIWTAPTGEGSGVYLFVGDGTR
jgi:antirestriction protein